MTRPWPRASSRASRPSSSIAPDWRTRADARLAVFDYIEAFYNYIEAFYNRQRRHSGLGHISPAAYERRYRPEDRIA